MKNKIAEACYSFLVLCFYGFIMAGAIFLGILLMPIIILALFVLAVKEIVHWKKLRRPSKPKHIVVAEKKFTAIVRSVTPDQTRKRAA